MTTSLRTWNRGICFRSELEARWDCLFRYLCWNGAVYEPHDLSRKRPDFLIKGGGCPSLVVSIKPSVSLFELRGELAAVELELDGADNHCVLLVGAHMPLDYVEPEAMGRMPVIGLMRHPLPLRADERVIARIAFQALRDSMRELGQREFFRMMSKPFGYVDMVLRVGLEQAEVSVIMGSARTWSDATLIRCQMCRAIGPAPVEGPFLDHCPDAGVEFLSEEEWRLLESTWEGIKNQFRCRRSSRFGEI